MKVIIIGCSFSHTEGVVEGNILYLRQAVDMALIHKLIMRWVDAALVNAEEILVGKICINHTKKINKESWAEK